MKVEYIGRLNFAPQKPDKPDEWELEESMALLYGNYMIILPIGSKTDGASIPWILYPILGSPMSDKNRGWAVVHDAGYRGYAKVVDIRTTILSPESIMESFNLMYDEWFVNPCMLSRDWWDKMCRDGAMVASKCPKWKRKIVYSGIKSFGWYSWSKHRRQKEN